MKCRNAEQWMDAVLDGAANGSTPPGHRAEFEAHVETCPHCRRQWQLLQAADAALRVPAPAHAPETLLADFRQRLEREAPPTRLPLWRTWIWPAGSLVAAGAAAALAISLNLHLVPTSRSESPSPAAQRVSTGGGAPASTAAAGAMSEEETRKAKDRISSSMMRGAVTAPHPGAAAPAPPVASAPLSDRSQSQADGRGEASSRANEGGDAAAKKAEVGGSAALSMPGDGGVPPTRLDLRPVPPALGKSVVPDNRPAATANAASDRERLNRVADAPAEASKQDKDKAQLSARASGTASAERVSPQNPAPAPGATPQQPAGGTVMARGGGVGGGFGGASGAGALGGQGGFGGGGFGDAAPAAPPPPARSPGARQQTPSPVQNDVAQRGAAPAGTLKLEQQAGQDRDAQVLKEQIAQELEVSPAILTALQRTVTPPAESLPLRVAADRLAEEADVPLRIDPRVPRQEIALDGTARPLWRVLESVAHQARLAVYPRGNELWLSPSGQAVQREVRLQTGPPGPSGPAGPAAPALKPAPAPVGRSMVRDEAVRRTTEPEAATRARGAQAPVNGPVFRAPAARPQAVADLAPPDRSVWPAEWGGLPERGFVVPEPEELMLGAPKAVGKELRPQAEFYRLAPEQKAPVAKKSARPPQQKPR